jgi:hypothetical protein
LSKKTGLYPKCLALDADNVTKLGKHPVAAGGFGDIWKGLIRGQMACLKIVRIYSESDVREFVKVRLQINYFYRFSAFARNF